MSLHLLFKHLMNKSTKCNLSQENPEWHMCYTKAARRAVSLLRLLDSSILYLSRARDNLYSALYATRIRSLIIHN
jgi:hypothetical protein